MNGAVSLNLAAVITREFQILNYIEAGVWIALAAGAAAWAWRANEHVVRRDLRILALALAAFGISDIVEAQTGAWWRPIWLLVWKGACLAVLLALLVNYARRRVRARSR